MVGRTETAGVRERSNLSGHCWTSHLVRKNQKFLLGGKLDDFLDVFSGEDLTSGVAGVDDDDNLDVALVLGGVV